MYVCLNNVEENDEAWGERVLMLAWLDTEGEIRERMSFKQKLYSACFYKQFW